MLVLAFDTATPATTVALHDGSAVLSVATELGAMSHGELLAPQIERVLADARASRLELTDIAVGVGPGPYTGLRVGLVTARTLGAALDLPVHGVCTLDVVAAQAARSGLAGAFTVATDARRKEVYWAGYESATDGRSAHRREGPAVDRPDVLADRLGPGAAVVGRGADLYPGDLHPAPAGARSAACDPDAGVLADLVARGLADVVAPDPLYLRRPDVSAAATRKRAS